MIQNNIKTIKDFIVDDKINDILLCNILNDELKLFYIYIIEYFCKKKNLTLQINIEREFVDDLFTKNIQLIETTSEKKILEISNNEKKIFFTNYRLFKKFKQYKYKLNSYIFKNDLNIFLNDYLNIHEKFVFDKIFEYPYLIYSELFNYKINKDESFINKETKNDFILRFRKELYQLKRLDGDVRKIYLNLKNEVRYKKFNFLIY